MESDLDGIDAAAGANAAPREFTQLADEAFAAFYRDLHAQFAGRQRVLLAKRHDVLNRAHRGELPQHLPPSIATLRSWSARVPSWCRDQRNLMSCPSNDAELVEKALNCGAPVVLLDLEDSVVNEWASIDEGTKNIIAALQGRTPGARKSTSTIFVRPRGLGISQHGIITGESTPASLFDLARIWYSIDTNVLRHPLAVSIPKSESVEEAFWWRDLFAYLAASRALPDDYIKCMVIDESHPLAYQLEEFAYVLRDHVVGLTLGRLDYMASIIDFNMNDPAWVLPDRNSIAYDVEFYQRLRELIVEISHKHGMLAIGGMTAIFPDRSDAESNARALRVLERDKGNEAACLMDGAWTGHPDQNDIAVRQFPFPNQRFARRPSAERYPDLRIPPAGAGARTLEGTRAAVAAVLHYRFGVLGGKGVSRINGYMEDMATERINRLIVAQRMRHSATVAIVDGDGAAVIHDERRIEQLFAEELASALAALPPGVPPEIIERYHESRRISERAIFSWNFDAV